MRLKATDTVHVSSVQDEPLLEGEQFDVDDDAGRSLVARGLAVEVKNARPHANKMEPTPANKAAKPPLSALSVSAKPKRK